MVTETTSEARVPLTRERVLGAAIDLADEHGIEALTMRRLAQELGVEAMSLYHHVANKQALLDGVVDAVIVELEEELGGFGVPQNSDWRTSLRTRVLAARQIMLRHPWAPSVIETRTTMPPTLLRYMNSVLGILVECGFSNDLAHHALHAIGSRALGFNQELFAPNDAQDEADGTEMLENLAADIPYIVGMLAEVSHDPDDPSLGWCDDQTEFEFGLDILLDGLESRRITQ